MELGFGNLFVGELTMEAKSFLAIMLVTLQFGFQPFLNNAFLSPNAIKSIVVIVQEIVKATCCLFVLIGTGKLSNVLKTSGFDFKSSLKIAALPSIIFSIQNVLAFYSYSKLDPLTFNLINQSKIIFAAIFLFFILNKKQTKRQLLALFVLFCISILLTIDTSNKTHDPNQQIGHLNFKNKEVRYGLIGVVIASILSGLAGTLVQKAVQSQTLPRHSLLYSTELAVWSGMFLFARLLIEMKYNIFDGKLIVEEGWNYEFEWKCLIPIAVNAIGGIGIGLVTKYSGVIAKSYSLIGGIMISGIIRSFAFDSPMTNAMYIGVPMVMLSLWLNADPNKNKLKQKEKEKEEKEKDKKKYE